MSGVGAVLFALLGTSLALDLTGCNGRPKVINTLMQLHGDIYSPGYQEGVNYPDDIMCQFTLVAPFGFRIRLSFVDMDIEVSDLCSADALIVHEGKSQEGPAHGIFCGNYTYPDLMSMQNAITIVFKSDFMVGKKGFHLKYSAGGFRNFCGIQQKVCRNRNCYNITQTCNGKDDCGDGSDEENCGYPPIQSTCGIRPASAFGDIGADRIIGGREAVPGSWPWQADMQLSFFHPNGHMCGGTLINSQWIVTAAHCFMQNKRAEEWRVHFGNHHKYFKDRTEQVRFVEQIIVYPEITGLELLQFQVEDLTHDIALMKLNAPVQFNDQVRPACLPTQGYKLNHDKKCMASGWGMTRGTGSNDVLKEVEIWIEEAKMCNGDMGPINNKTMICVSNRKGFQDLCHGDSGGPLVCEINNKWHVMGATSHGTRSNYEGGLCAMPESKTVYASVPDKVDWIQKILNKYS